MRRFGSILWGIVFVAVGCILGLNAMGITDISIFFRGWWTLFIIVPSFIGLLSDRSGKVWNSIFLIIGVLLLLANQGLVPFYILSRLWLPIILVIVGIGFIFRDVLHTKVTQKIHELNKSGNKEYAATFGEQKLEFHGEDFEGASVSAVFGSVRLDLRDAILTKEQVVDASAIFGGVEILLPKDINVEVRSTPIFGGVSNSTTKIKGENIPTLYVNAFCMFGGVEIR